ncbi:MAG: bifunctional indole-3-glycerol-phosphate synthase TrpC/phosphoribosylanthranilate isomerase TrpF [Proteobacteria bacterium]|nr:bifunctional indole-3-glycerol-phosphate synthase TrpC/phosphoribosylanthranilate isomerase TrpF [Pseudomonadota bacterium]
MTAYLPGSIRPPSLPKEGVLDLIVANRTREIARERQQNQMPLKNKVKRRKPLSLIKALKKPGARFIFECKKASPTHGPLAPGLDITSLAETYARFADAVSVLTEKKFFGGSLEDLSLFRSKLNVPILAKDFFIDEVQVLDAHRAGADAILLMLSILDDKTYLHLRNYAKGLGLEILTEVHTAAEMERANSLGAELIGINNRDLKTLKISFETTRKLAPLARPGALLVSESGIATRQDVIALGKHVGAFLIGSALMRSNARDLLVRRLVFGEVKICGITRKSDAHDAYQCGATYGGLNFVAGTPRAIPPSRARKIKAGIPLGWIGVFRGRAPEYAADIAAQLDLSGVQLHGRETPAYRARLRSLLPEGCEIWQALALDGGPAPRTLPHADRLLFDTRTASQFGGTGRAFDWAHLNQTKMPSGYGLAGGIHAGNVLAALAAGAPLIDICSGVETAPGIKSLKKMKDLFRTIRKFNDSAAEQRPC